MVSVQYLGGDFECSIATRERRADFLLRACSRFWPCASPHRVADGRPVAHSIACWLPEPLPQGWLAQTPLCAPYTVSNAHLHHVYRVSIMKNTGFDKELIFRKKCDEFDVPAGCQSLRLRAGSRTTATRSGSWSTRPRRARRSSATATASASAGRRARRRTWPRSLLMAMMPGTSLPSPMWLP